MCMLKCVKTVFSIKYNTVQESLALWMEIIYRIIYLTTHFSTSAFFPLEEATLYFSHSSCRNPFYIN